MFIISKQDSYKMEPEETDRNFRKKGVIYLQYFTPSRLIKIDFEIKTSAKSHDVSTSPRSFQLSE